MKIKHITYAFVVFCFAVLTAAPAAAGSRGKLVINETLVDFGTMKEGKVAEKVVTLSNTGNQPLTVTNVTTS